MPDELRKPIANAILGACLEMGIVTQLLSK